MEDFRPFARTWSSNHQTATTESPEARGRSRREYRTESPRGRRDFDFNFMPPRRQRLGIQGMEFGSQGLPDGVRVLFRVLFLFFFLFDLFFFGFNRLIGRRDRRVGTDERRKLSRDERGGGLNRLVRFSSRS